MKYKMTLPDDWKPPWWREGDPVEFILQDSVNEKDYDVVLDGLPDELVERMYECLECLCRDYHDRRFGRETTNRLVDEWINTPLGVDRWHIKQRVATITPITE